MSVPTTRREFLKLGAIAGLPLVMPRLAFSQATPGSSAATRDVLVVVFQRGGMDGLNVVIPHGDADYYRLRPTLALPRPGSGSGAAIDLDGHFGLHPALAPLQRIYAQGRLAMVHATGAPSGSRSHFSSQDMMERAVLGALPLFTGWLNRHLVSIGNSGIFQGVGVGTAVPRSLSGSASVVGINAFDDFTVDTHSIRPRDLSDSLITLYGNGQALDITAQSAFSAVDALALANPGQYGVENDATYPATDFGRQMQQVAQLIKADVGLEVATVDIGGWDHHDDELRRLSPLLDEFGQTLAAFDTDLGARMQRVIVVSMSEFGRRAYENASGGTDHGTGNCMFVLGGGVNGGRVYANWPGLADGNLVQGDLAISTDYRAVLAELLRKRRSEAALDQVFPGLASAPELGVFATAAG